MRPISRVSLTPPPRSHRLATVTWARLLKTLFFSFRIDSKYFFVFLHDSGTLGRSLFYASFVSPRDGFTFGQSPVN